MNFYTTQSKERFLAEVRKFFNDTSANRYHETKRFGLAVPLKELEIGFNEIREMFKTVPMIIELMVFGFNADSPKNEEVMRGLFSEEKYQNIDNFIVETNRIKTQVESSSGINVQLYYVVVLGMYAGYDIDVYAIDSKGYPELKIYAI
jgi:hypothetical protein